MKNLIFFFLFLIIGYCLGHSQNDPTALTGNLILNPGFEDFFGSSSQEEGCTSFFFHWYKFYYSTPDYFLINDTSIYHKALVNIYGYHPPNSGNAFIGLIPINWLGYFEAIIGTFSETLIKDQNYVIKAHVRFALDSCWFEMRSFDVMFMDSLSLLCLGTSPYYDTYYVSNKHKKLKLPSTVFPLDENDNNGSWNTITTNYKAKGGENYIFIGLTNRNKKLFKLIGKFGKIYGEEHLCSFNEAQLAFIRKHQELMKLSILNDQKKPFLFPYYFFDDISVTEKKN